MEFYKKELDAIKRAGRYRSREVYDSSFLDLASNDYLNLAENKTIFKKAYERVLCHDSHSPKSSMLVNGYHPIHKEFEEYVSELTGFDETIVVGSGFLANLSLIEALVRKGDILLLDEEFHASGILASRLVKNTQYFKHDNPKELEKLLKSYHDKRVIVAVEGVYSMEGDVLNPKIVEICDKYNAIMIIDEAHSMGVLGDNLLGVYDYFGIKPKQNHIKMATLGKASGSYGAYISASSHIISYLVNRAKPIIYSTAPSVFDIALAMESYKYIQENKTILRKKRDSLLEFASKLFEINLNSLILKIEIGDNKKVLDIQKRLKEQGIMIGAIRTPTVKSAILRVILRVGVDEEEMKKALEAIYAYTASLPHL